MLAAIRIAWAVMMWRAAHDPEQHVLFIDFTILASAAHAFVMLISTPIQKGLVMTLIEGVPLLVTAAGLWWLRPGPSLTRGRPLLSKHVSHSKISSS